MKRKFRVTYYCDDACRYVEEFCEFEDWEGRATLDGKDVGPVIIITAKQWAEDWAYALTDKGNYDLEEISG